MYFFSCVLAVVSAVAEDRLSGTADTASYMSGIPAETCDAQSLLQLRSGKPRSPAEKAARNARTAPLFDITSDAKFCRIGGVVPYWNAIGEQGCSFDLGGVGFGWLPKLSKVCSRLYRSRFFLKSCEKDKPLNSSRKF